MNEHIVTSFNDVMDELSDELVHMGQLVRKQLKGALKALETRNADLAKRIRKNDKQVDAINDDIEERVMNILALRQPVAVDLRETIAALKIARELERIGDLARNTAKRSKVILEEEPIKGMDEIAKMGEVAIKIVEDVMAAYQARDVEKAIAVWNADEEIDDYCNTVFTQLLSGMMVDNSNINACTQMTFVAKNLERVGDHATNVAETIHYVLTGDRIDERRPKNDKTSSTIVEI
ncbi:MAG: phosphate signaling complex protein PhoU [Marinicaulis sp.]|nr:phosphate signaling complex protein PhoU [Marinicaulis sp.]NNE40818.1 phosphate signaling complex protein PhoU [Marinicaulis sp.]NNL90186.1 phosphate signaling complex protein PhoU [Marinicaulis sp.]